MRLPIAWLLLALLTSVGACSAISEMFVEPDVQLERVVVRGVDLPEEIWI